MAQTHISDSRSGLVTGSRWVLTILATLFTLGAFIQFFLVGVSFFDDAARWNDHATVGHTIGLLPWVMWIPALLGKTGRGMIIATVLLFILFEAQYAFINVDNTIAQAFHPLNGSVLLVLGWSITQRSVALLRGELRDARVDPDAPGAPDRLEGTST